MATDGSFSLVGVPIDCVGEPGGTELSPDVLRREGLTAALQACDCGDIDVRIDCNLRDQASGVIGIESVCRTTVALRRMVSDLLAAGHRPFLVGGCCTELIGALAGARDHFGAVGLFYLDGHIDLYDGSTSPTGEAADIPVATVLGHGPAELLEVIGPGVVLKPQHLALLGYRDLEEAKSLGSLLPEQFEPAMMHYDVQAVRKAGPRAIGERAQNALAKNPGRYWMHIDFDVLDEEIFPATDYLMPGGLEWRELTELVGPVTTDTALIGVSIACYNPDKDPDRKYARQIVSWFHELFLLKTPARSAQGCGG